MHTGRHYTVKEMLVWTRKSIYWLVLLAVIPTALYAIWDVKWLAITWVPVALLGTAAAFITGFRNNATYARAWEARKIWGAIVNSSRTWGIMARDLVGHAQASPETLALVHRQLIYRHMAWFTALRFQLREKRSWENIFTRSYNREYARHYYVAEWHTKMEEELKPYLSPEDLQYVLGKKNRATHLIALQSAQLKALAKDGWLDTYRLVELERMLQDFYEQQGKCERIKNFPYPRQFATVNLFFIRLFVCMVPFGMLSEFNKLGEYMVWLTVPFSVLVTWVFMTLERIGESTENPFEGSPNDIPITAMSRTIEIDLREMLDEPEIPPALQPVNNILM
ncbi:bestrophin family protein [Chitinophaga japonensis]|uniref:Putative membrane protein n=1 Tax=Chitinophaga japonensis TaxID=104662 RepID=A0A562TBY6_CHIJA|nr:bestrophin family ion channel [Chitinophaga japonensis]TWI91015.1 putative membrane protein [Chitinophaga japonensis]